MTKLQSGEKKRGLWLCYDCEVFFFTFRTTLYIYHLQVWVSNHRLQQVWCQWAMYAAYQESTNNLSKVVVGHPKFFALHHVISSLCFPSQEGGTPLMTASYFGHSSVVRVLLQAGATINTTNQVRYRLFHTRYRDFVKHTTAYYYCI